MADSWPGLAGLGGAGRGTAWRGAARQGKARFLIPAALAAVMEHVT